jgi:hypothetical protein
LCVRLPFKRSSWRALQARTPSIDGGRRATANATENIREQKAGKVGVRVVVNAMSREPELAPPLGLGL